jgi:hypothetical protein
MHRLVPRLTRTEASKGICVCMRACVRVRVCARVHARFKRSCVHACTEAGAQAHAHVGVERDLRSCAHACARACMRAFKRGRCQQRFLQSCVVIQASSLQTKPKPHLPTHLEGGTHVLRADHGPQLLGVHHREAVHEQRAELVALLLRLDSWIVRLGDLVVGGCHMRGVLCLGRLERWGRSASRFMSFLAAEAVHSTKNWLGD